VDEVDVDTGIRVSHFNCVLNIQLKLDSIFYANYCCLKEKSLISLIC
jgi:hypothetical protein